MPKVEIDYSNTLIYKITCKDVTITDLYVGHTINFVQRKYAHKQGCIKEQCKLYTTIRNNGGWDNWMMEIIGFFKCKDQYEARQKEQEYFELLHATLNSIEPMPKPKLVEIKENPISLSSNPNTKQFECNLCDYICYKQSEYNKHLATLKHKEKQNPTLNILTYSCECNKTYKHLSTLYAHKKQCVVYNNTNTHLLNNVKDIIVEKEKTTIKSCNFCNYTTIYSKDYNKHLNTIKHKNNKIKNGLNKLYSCKLCCKNFKDRAGLWRHKQKCVSDKHIIEKETTNKDEIIMLLIKQNSDLIKEQSNINKIMIEFINNKNSV
jgi:hypothetical protein